MADPRTFVLIGNFTDNITPALERINSSISKLKTNISDLQSATRPLKKDFKDLADLSKDFNTSLKNQATDIRQMTTALKAFRGEMGRVNRAYRAGGSRVMRQAAAPPPPPPVRTPEQIAYGPRARAGRGYDGAGLVAGGIAGVQLSNAIEGAIVAGFRIGTQMMVRPFQMAAGAIGERIRDELTDISTAGGVLSVAKRQGADAIVKDFSQAMELTQKTNKYMADLAAALPGSTQDYIEVGKRMGDTAARLISKDVTKAVQYANELAIKAGRAPIKGVDQAAQQRAYTEIVGNMARQGVLAGLGEGGGGGRGGVTGAYGLPMLMERMYNQDVVSMGQFQRYAAIFRDPKIMDALERYIPKINATTKGTVDRAKALDKFFEDVLPPEMIRAFERSTSGVIEAFRTAFVGPETGFLGLGRKMQGLGKKMNMYGQYVDKFGKVVEDAAMAAEADLSIFDLLRDIFANLGISLYPILRNLQLLWDPLKNIGKTLSEAREATAKFLMAFDSYKKGLETFAKGLSPGELERFSKVGLDLRASLAAINNLFTNLGVFTEKEFAANANKIMSLDFDAGAMLKEFAEKFMTSKLATQIGEFLGTLIGTVLRQVADAAKFASEIAEGSGLGGGFASAFQKAGGFSAIQDIFVSIIQLFIKALATAITKMPLLTAGLVALKIIPMIIGEAVQNMVQRCMGTLQGGACAMPGAGGKGGRRGGFMGMFESPAMERRRRRFTAPYARGAQTLGAFGKDAMTGALGLQPGRALIRQRGALGNLARTGAKAGRMIPGGALAGGVIDMGLALASGENFGKAASGAIGTVLGGIAGSAFGPVGTMIGMTAGGMIGDAAADAISNLTKKGPSLEQLHAAQMQNEAAVKQLQAAKLQRGGLTEEKATYTFGTTQQFADRLKVLGLESDKAGAALKNLYGRRESAAGAAEKAAKELNDKIKALKDNKVPSDLIAKQVKPLQEQFNKAKKNLERAQADFDTQFRKTPEVIQRSIANSLSTLSFKSLETILANKIAGLNVQAPPNPLTIPNPYDQPTPEITIPDWSNTYGNQYFKWDKKPSPNDVFFRAKGGLGDAIASEMRMKPPGSDLVIANSSETVIPAAGGHGMMDFVETLRWGFGAMMGAFKEAQQKQDSLLKSINQTLQSNQQATNAKLTALEKKFTTPGMAGGLGGAAAGGVDAFTGMAQKYGLQMTSGFRPGDPGWHGANRARDYSNGTGPTPQMLAFAQFLASNYGANLKELIYTPLGFSIKNGQKVPPYAQAGHYNHVHVAYALGLGQGVAFNSLKGAQSWENSMVPGSVRVASVTGNSAEGFGGGTTINGGINVSVHAGNISDPDELASIVALKIGEAVADARASSIFV